MDLRCLLILDGADGWLEIMLVPSLVMMAPQSLMLEVVADPCQ